MQQRSEETRQRICAAASQLFSRQGYNATSVAEICAAAGVSKGAFYYHFPTKQALFLELLNEWLAGLDAAFELLRKEAQSVPDAIRSMAQMAGQVLQSTDSSRSILLEFWMQAYRDPAIWQAAIAPYQRYVQYFSNLFRQGIEEGTVIQTNPDAAARAIVALGMGILMQALVNAQSIPWDQEVHQDVNLLLNGLIRR